MAYSLVTVLGLALIAATFLHFGILDVFGEIPPFHPSYENRTEAPTSGNTFYGPDGHCGWWNGSGYEKPLMNYTNAFRLVGSEADDGDDDDNHREQPMGSKDKGKFCLHQFHRAAMQPVCGDPFYPMVKYCAMVEFFKNQKPAPLQGDDADMVLMLVDGCVICKKNPDEHNQHQQKEHTVTIRLVNTWEKGSTFTSCSQEENEVGSVKVTAQQSNYFDSQLTAKMMGGSGVGKEYYEKFRGGFNVQFSFPAVLYQRICKGAFDTDEKAKYYSGMKLEVEHDCGGANRKFTVDLANITNGDFVNNMVELRGMMLLLDENNSKWLQYRMEGYNYMSKEALNNGPPVYDNLKDV